MSVHVPIKEELLEYDEFSGNSEIDTANKVSATADLRQTLLQFQNTGFLCDTELIGSNGRVKVHGVVLAAASDIFRTALSGDSDTSAQHTVILNDVELDVLKIVVHLAYTGEMMIPPDYSSGSKLEQLLNVLSKIGLGVPIPSSDTFKSYSGGNSLVDNTSKLNNCPVPSSLARCSNPWNAKVAKPLGRKPNVSAGYNSRLRERLLSPMALVAPATVPKEKANESRKKDTGAIAKAAAKPKSKDTAESTVTLKSEGGADSESVLKHHQCQVCGERFRLAHLLRQHMHRYHSAVSAADDSELNNTSDERNDGELDFNLMEVATSAAMQSSDTAAATVADDGCPIIAMKRRKINLCEFCGQVFDDSHKLRNHKTSHYGELTPFKCTECGREYRQKGKLKEHVEKEHRGVRHVCEHCGSSYRNQISFREHMLAVHPDLAVTDPKIKPVQCPICYETFARKKVYMNHMQKQHPSPNDPKEFTCQYCTRKYSSSESLRYHVYLKHRELNAMRWRDQSRQKLAAMVRASKVKKENNESNDAGREQGHACRVCGRRYLLADSLRVHMRLKHSVKLKM